MRWSEIGSWCVIAYVLAACEHGVLVGESWTDAGPPDASSGGAAGSVTGSGGSSGGASGSGGAGGMVADADPPDGGMDTPDGSRARPLACIGNDGTPVRDEGMDGGNIVQNLIGKWLLCSPTGWFGTSDEAGLEFTPDGHWYNLYATPSGDLERGAGPERAGTWGYNASWGAIEIQAGRFIRPSLTREPHRMRLDNSGNAEPWIADYVDAALDDAGAGPVPPPYDGGPVPAGCSMEGTRVQIDSESALKSALVGSWILCERPSIFGTSDEIGIEFVDDGTWFKLYASGAGTIVRGGGFDRQGLWSPNPDSTTDAGPYGNFDLLPFGGSVGIVAHPTFTSSPRKLNTSPRGSYIYMTP